MGVILDQLGPEELDQLLTSKEVIVDVPSKSSLLSSFPETPEQEISWAVTK